MFRDLKDVKASDFVPGTVVAVFEGSLNCIAVVFKKDVWAELAFPEINANAIARVVDNEDFIPLRIIGCVKGHTGNPDEYKKSTEPGDIVIRRYTYATIGSGTRIVDNLQDLLDSYFLFSRIHGVFLTDYVQFELSLLRKYLAGDYSRTYIQEDSMYDNKMLLLFKKGIPQFVK